MKILYFVMVVIVSLSVSAFAADFTWDGGGANNNWTTPENWNPDGTLGIGDRAYIPYIPGHIPVFNSNTELYAIIYGRAGDTGQTVLTIDPSITVTLSPSSPTGAGGYITLGEHGDANTVLNFSGTLNARFVGVATLGKGTVNMTGGEMNLTTYAASYAQVRLGNNDGHGVAVFNLSNGTINLLDSGNPNYNYEAQLVIGYDGGTGDEKLCQFNISGGRLNLKDATNDYGKYIAIGYGTDVNNAELNLSGTGIIDMTSTGDTAKEVIQIARGTGSRGVFNQTGGTVTVQNGTGGWDFISIGWGSGSVGTYNFSAGAATTDTTEVGRNGKGIFNVSGIADLNIARLRLGAGAGGKGICNINGGNITADQYICIGYADGALASELYMNSGVIEVPNLTVGGDAPGLFEMTGGTINLYGTPTTGSVSIKVGGIATADCEGTWNMQGGTITLEDTDGPYISVGYANTGNNFVHTVNMSGGLVYTPELIIGDGGKGRVNLSGGTIEITSGWTLFGDPALHFDAIETGEGVLNLCGGQVRWIGDHSSDVAGYISAGKIVAYNGTGRVAYLYDSESGKTIIYSDNTAYDPTPSDGQELVPPVTTLLQWTNPFAGQTVYCDVYISTNPTMSGATKIVDHLAVSSVNVTPLASTIYYWRVDTYDPVTNAKTTGVIWNFSTTPYGAVNPDPNNGELNVPRNQILSWEVAGSFDSFNVYISEDPENLVLQGNQPASDTDFVPNLQYKKTYYWRIDSVKNGVASTGYLWSFTTLDPQCTVSYNDGDLNGDCWVNFEDIAIMMRNWVSCGWDIPEACE